MSTPQNNIDRIDRNYTAVRITVTTDAVVNAGDLVLWDTTTGGGVAFNRAIPAGGSVAVGASNFLGMSVHSNNQLIYPGDAAQVGIEILVRGAVWLNTKVGDTYLTGTPVYCATSTDPQTVQVSSSGTLVGYALIDPPLTPRPNQATPTPESLVGASGVRVRVVLAPNVAWAAAI